MTVMEQKTPLLEVLDVVMRFGGLVALDGVATSFYEGQIHGIIGPNGAGKTTLFNVISGLYAPTSGDVWYRGQSIKGLQTYQIAELGIIRTFQTVRLFEGMSAIENVMVGRHRLTHAGFASAALRLRSGIAEDSETRAIAYKLLEEVGLESVAEMNAVDLPLGWQRRLEIARGLASEPDLMLLDEPAAGLNNAESSELSQMIRDIRDQGVTVILVEHDMDVVMSVVDHVFVLDQGRRLAEGAPAEIQQNPDVIRAYLGDE